MNKLTAYLLAFLAATLCSKAPEPEPTKKFRIESDIKENITLDYDATTIIDYSAYDFDGNVTAKLSTSIDNVSLKNSFDTKTGKGAIAITSTCESAQKKNNLIVFTDEKHNQVSIPVVIQINGKALELYAHLHRNNIVLTNNSAVTVTYNVQNEQGAVSAMLLDNANGDIHLENSYDSAKKEGTLTFSTSFSGNKEINTSILFSDTVNTYECPLTIKITEYADIPKITLEKANIKVYESSVEYSSTACFQVSCETEYTLTISESKYCNVNINNNGDSYTVTFVSKDLEEKWSEDISIVAETPAGADEKIIRVSSVLFHKAYFDEYVPGSNSSDDSWNSVFGIDSEYRLDIKTDDETGKFVSINQITCSNTPYHYRVYFTIQPNPLKGERKGKYIVTDENGVVRQLDFTQKISQAQIDRAALMELYYALNGPNWVTWRTEKNPVPTWGTDAPLCEWEYISTPLETINYPDGTWEWKDRRVTEIDLESFKTMKGRIPDEINKLTNLEVFRISYQHPNRITGFPSSIMGLTKLKEFTVNETKFLENKKLDSEGFKFLKEYIKNLQGRRFGFNLDYCDLRGTIPEWTIDAYDFSVAYNRLSGQIPDKVAKSSLWNKKINGIFWNPKTGEKEQMYDVKYGELMINLQYDNFALWEGERPECTKFVEDEYGGHWEWTDGRFPLPNEDNMF